MATTREPFDCSGKIGPLYPEALGTEWPMFSFARPATIVWNAIGAELRRRGWTDNQIRDWLQSKATRWALDMTLGEMLRKVGTEYAACAEMPDARVCKLGVSRAAVAE